ncbi:MULTISPECIES: phosphate ABC transporter permease PstA [unclassified Janibacter]|uniref:phosphate ABC transporter permease PstA n=1 Tax=unclassified Janibacter TaxID=2649294 RepID=UPI003D061D4D
MTLLHGAPASPTSPTAPVPDAGTVIGTVRPADHRPTTPPPPRRALGQATDEDLVARWGPVLAGFSLAWLICHRLLPWSGLLALFLVGTALTIILTAVVAALRGRGPEVADAVASVVVHVGALIVFGALASAVIFTFLRGLEALPHLNMYTDDMAGVGPRDSLTKGGFAHAIVGSLIQIGIAVAITVPLGIGTAVFMTEVGGTFAKVVRTVVEAMTALPSIVAGLFIYTVVIMGLGVGRSGIAAGLAISVMMLPIIARAADVVLRVVPGNLREASLALGASRWKTVWHVVLPTARPGLATALILGIARGVGETSPILLTSGAAPFFVTHPFDGPMNSLPLFIFNAVRSGEPALVERGFGAASALLALVLVLFVVARRLARPRRTTSRRTRRPAQATR